MIRVLYFGRVAERMGSRVCNVSAESASVSLYALRAQLFEAIDDWASPQAPSLLMSVNQTLTRVDAPLKAGDEVAFFSPFSGG